MELLLVIGIITLVASIGVYSGVSVRKGARVSAAKILLQGLKNVAVEYETVMEGRTINANGVGAFDWTRTQAFNAGNQSGSELLGEALNSSERFVIAAFSLESAQDLLETAARDYLMDLDGNGYLDVADPWGTPIEFASFPDARFRSAGPDQVFGTDDDVSSQEMD